MRLYYAPQTRSMRARWMLEEIGAPYELVRVDLSAGEQREVNPCCRVSALAAYLARPPANAPWWTRGKLSREQSRSQG